MKRSYSTMSSGDRTDKLFSPAKHSPAKAIRKQSQYGGLMHACGILSSPAKRSMSDPKSEDALNMQADMARHRERVNRIHAQLDRDHSQSTNIDQSHGFLETKQTVDSSMVNPDAEQSSHPPSSAASQSSSPSLIAATTPPDDSDDELIELGSPTSPEAPQLVHASIPSTSQSSFQSILQSPGTSTQQSSTENSQSQSDSVRHPSARRSLLPQFSPLPPMHATPQSSKQVIESIIPSSRKSARRALFQQSPQQSPLKSTQAVVKPITPLKPIRPADAEKVRRSLANRFALAAQPIEDKRIS